jgi:hypothetical protein
MGATHLSSKLYGESQKGRLQEQVILGIKQKSTSKIASAKGLGHGSSGRALPRRHYWSLHWEEMPDAYFFSKEWEALSSSSSTAPNQQHNTKNPWGCNT